MIEKNIEDRLDSALTLQLLIVANQSHLHEGHASSPGSGNSHFHLTIRSSDLDSMSRVQKHKVIYGLLKDLMPDPIHALSITFLPREED